MRKVCFGVIGVGNMGSHHAQQLLAGKVKRAELVAVGDLDPARLAQFPDVQRFTDSRALIRSGAVDAVLIATPPPAFAPPIELGMGWCPNVPDHRVAAVKERLPAARGSRNNAAHEIARVGGETDFRPQG
jgi:hypothetical protein